MHCTARRDLQLSQLTVLIKPTKEGHLLTDVCSAVVYTPAKKDLGISTQNLVFRKENIQIFTVQSLVITQPNDRLTYMTANNKSTVPVP